MGSKSLDDHRTGFFLVRENVASEGNGTRWKRTWPSSLSAGRLIPFCRLVLLGCGHSSRSASRRSVDKVVLLSPADFFPDSLKPLPIEFLTRIMPSFGRFSFFLFFLLGVSGLSPSFAGFELCYLFFSLRFFFIEDRTGFLNVLIAYRPVS